MTTPREEKPTDQPEINQPKISPEWKEAVEREINNWLFDNATKNPIGYHVQQLLNASAAQQREEIAKLTKERDDAIALNQLYHHTRHENRDFAKNAQEQRDGWQKEATENEERANFYQAKHAETENQLQKEIMDRSKALTENATLRTEIATNVAVLEQRTAEANLATSLASALRARLEVMRDDLKEYGRHYQSCRIGISCVCSCGLDAALASEAPNSTRKEGDPTDAPEKQWKIRHPGTGEPLTCASFEEAMSKWFEGFNIPVLFTNETPEAFETANERVKKYLARDAVVGKETL